MIFGKSANNKIGHKYGLKHTEICELMRVALKEHKTPVTQILKVCLKILRNENPGIKLVVSYADPEQGHEGKIYKAGNWIYEGLTDPVDYYKRGNGDIIHWRNARFIQKTGLS